MANKKIRLTEEAYDILLSWKEPDESLSDCILRLYEKKEDRKS